MMMMIYLFAKTEYLLHSLEKTAGSTGLLVNANKTEYMHFKREGTITTLSGEPLKLAVDKFTYFGSSVSSTENDVNICIAKVWTTIDRLSIIQKSDLSDKTKRDFFQAVTVLILLYGCTTWTLTKRTQKKLDGSYTGMLQAILNKFWWQHPKKPHLYGHLLPISKTIQVRRKRHAGHCWRSKDELISDVLPSILTHGRVSVSRPTRSYLQQLSVDMGCSLENLLGAMDERDR